MANTDGAQTRKREIMDFGREWEIWAEDAQGRSDGLRDYYGTKIGAKIAAGKLAGRLGRGWKPFFAEKESEDCDGYATLRD